MQLDPQPGQLISTSVDPVHGPAHEGREYDAHQPQPPLFPGRARLLCGLLRQKEHDGMTDLASRSVRSRDEDKEIAIVDHKVSQCLIERDDGDLGFIRT